MFLETPRLRLLPLDVRQLDLWVHDLPALERELGIAYQAEPIEGFFRQIVAGQLAIAQGDPANYLWHSFWFLIRQADGVVVGSADFKAPPDAQGAVEIGYGLGKAFERQGYMTEAVEAMCGWAERQRGVTFITAETDLDGFASQRILQRCGFHETARQDTIWWARRCPESP